MTCADATVGWLVGLFSEADEGNKKEGKDDVSCVLITRSSLSVR